ncbi:response regulator transcription factor [Breznakibacter xylanolyticus]|nr:response regulator [Breznakibacter xylanolyticus]
MDNQLVDKDLRKLNHAINLYDFNQQTYFIFAKLPMQASGIPLLNALIEDYFGNFATNANIMFSHLLSFLAGAAFAMLIRHLWATYQKPVNASPKEASEVSAHHAVPTTPEISPNDTSDNATEESQRERPLVLLIEDDSELSGYLAGMLSQHYTVIVEDDGKKGITQATQLQPDLVITDVMLPSMNGRQICRHLKTTFETSHIPVLMLTAMSDDSDIEQGLSEGADSYLTKPFNIKVVMAQVASLIRSRQQWQQRLGKPLLQCPDNITIPPLDRRFMDELSRIMEEELGNPNFDVSGLVSRMHMGHSTVLRKLKALTGMSPVDYIRSYRMQKAAYIFQKEKLPVSEVSYHVGYSDPKYFSKCFAREFGKTPKAYMKEIHEGTL